MLKAGVTHYSELILKDVTEKRYNGIFELVYDFRIRKETFDYRWVTEKQ